LAYAEKHVTELFEQARHGDEVLIVRSNGRAHQLLLIAKAPVEDSESEELKSPRSGDGR